MLLKYVSGRKFRKYCRAVCFFFFFFPFSFSFLESIGYCKIIPSHIPVDWSCFQSGPPYIHWFYVTIRFFTIFFHIFSVLEWGLPIGLFFNRRVSFHDHHAYKRWVLYWLLFVSNVFWFLERAPPTRYIRLLTTPPPFVFNRSKNIPSGLFF